jgi:ATP-dependent protease Clp ATPase subunit
VSKLVAGPNVFICDACLEIAERALNRVSGVSGDLRRARDGAKDRCTFCSHRNSATRAVVAGPTANICSECMRLCREFMTGAR